MAFTLVDFQFPASSRTLAYFTSEWGGLARRILSSGYWWRGELPSNVDWNRTSQIAFRQSQLFNHKSPIQCQALHLVAFLV